MTELFGAVLGLVVFIVIIREEQRKVEASKRTDEAFIKSLKHHD